MKSVSISGSEYAGEGGKTEKITLIETFTGSYVLQRLRGTPYKRIKKVHNEELHNFYSSLNIVSIIKSRKTSLVGHIAHI
jgi:hypothetical protein